MRISDWSSDVCSSDLVLVERLHVQLGPAPQLLLHRHSALLQRVHNASESLCSPAEHMPDRAPGQPVLLAQDRLVAMAEEIESADDLYTLDPSEFVTARNALAKQRRKEGRSEERTEEDTAESKALKRI